LFVCTFVPASLTSLFKRERVGWLGVSLIFHSYILD
jgi:hypothetical protein